MLTSPYAATPKIDKQDIFAVRRKLDELRSFNRQRIGLTSYVDADPINKVDPTGMVACAKDAICVTGRRPRADGGGGGSRIGGYFGGLAGRGGGGGAQNQNDLLPEEQTITVVGMREPKRNIRSAPFQPKATPLRAADQFTVMAAAGQRQDQCGSSGISRHVPDQIGSVDLRSACATHDACYATPGASKLSCDTKLAEDVYIECLSQTGLIASCRNLSSAYLFGVFFGSIVPFNQSR